MMELIKKHAQKIKFGIVGLANTALDFIILFVLVGFGLDKIPANYISTGVSFIFSFFVNKKFTFKSTTGNAKKQFLVFSAVTMVGLWIIQPLVIAGVAWLLGSTGWTEGVILFAAKIVATVASLVWNYLFYSRLVFKEVKEK